MAAGDLSRTVGRTVDTLMGDMKDLLLKAPKMSAGSDSMLVSHGPSLFEVAIYSCVAGVHR